MSANKKVFKDYANFYDTIYADKDYAGETSWIARQVAKLGVSDGRWLDLGCGTGRHLAQLPKKKFERFGIDMSAEMIAEARQRLPDARLEVSDIHTIPFEPPFDVVSAIFAVVSYLPENQALDRFLATVSSILKPGGIAYFDVWHGAAVLVEGPQERWQSYAGEDGEVIRLCQPIHRPESHTVDICYRLLHIAKENLLAEVNEVHTMRYYFIREVVEACSRNGLTAELICPFLDETKPISPHEWSMAVFGKKES